MYSSLVWSSNSALDISGGTSLLDDMAILYSTLLPPYHLSLDLPTFPHLPSPPLQAQYTT